MRFPWSLYRNDPNWVPPLRSSQAPLLGYRPHPFRHVGEIQTFLAWRGREVVGQIAAIINHAHDHEFHERRGFFGFFEAVDDCQVSRALFDAAREWLEEHDAYGLRGPVNPSMNYVSGMLVDGFDSPPTFSLPYNPSYYPRLLTDYGFRKAHDMFAFLGYRDELPDFQRRLDPLTDQIQERWQPVIRPLDTSRSSRDVDRFLELFNRSLEGMWGFVPLARAELEYLMSSLRHLIEPQFALLAEVEGKLAGAVIGVPDYNPRIRQIDGRLWPFGFLRLLSRRGLKRFCVLAMAVAPEYQRWGLGLVLLRSLLPKTLELGFAEAEFSWISETNTLAIGGMRKAGLHRSKTFRMYDFGDAAIEERVPTERPIQRPAVTPHDPVEPARVN
ncbi:MAG TPA: GNAT family N-acetyltransferase [Pirellulales bacterium]|nr:GNAT family N-acetyltransferase [Pirellulales bacterium]